MRASGFEVWRIALGILMKMNRVFTSRKPLHFNLIATPWRQV